MIFEAQESPGVCGYQCWLLVFLGPERKESNRLAQVKGAFAWPGRKGRAMFTFGQGVVRARHQGSVGILVGKTCTKR